MSDAGGGFRAPGPPPRDGSGWSGPDEPPAGGESGAGPAPGPAPGSAAWAPPTWHVMPPVLRPGIIPLRPLGLGDLYGGVISAIRGNVQATIGAGLLVGTIVLAVLTPLGLVVSRWELGYRSTSTDPYAADLAPTIGEQIPTLAGVVTPVVLATFVAFVISQAVLGRRVGLGETWRTTRGRLLPVLGGIVVAFIGYVGASTAILAVPVILLISAAQDGSQGSIVTAVLILVAGVLLTLVAIAYLWTRWAFTAPAIVLEKVGVITGFRRSWALTSGRLFWRVLGTRLLTALLIGVASYVLTLPISAVGVAVVAASGFDPGAVTTTNLVMNSLSVLIATALTTPFSAGFDSLLYIDQRMRMEALDVTLIQATSDPTSAGRRA